MPELPDLEVIKDFLGPRLSGVSIQRVEVGIPLVVRRPTPAQFVSLLEGNTLQGVERRAKFLLLPLASGHLLALHPMLTGRLQYCPPDTPRKPRTCLVFHLEGGKELRYFDEQLMGKVYLVAKEETHLIPRFSELGPDALDPGLTPALFEQRLRRYRGQIKNVLTNEECVSGIGNAYADEILFAARIHPYRPRTQLSPQEVEALYGAVRTTLSEAIAILQERVGDRIEKEIRDFLKVHRKGAQPCPRCGSPITEIQANRRITSYCRHCQS